MTAFHKPMFASKSLGSGCTLHEVVDSIVDPPVYSCIVVSDLARSGPWPALGGTRWTRARLPTIDDIRAHCVHEAHALTRAMEAKNRLLRLAERTLAAEDLRWKSRTSLFGWVGGKGVIWSPDERLSPARLLVHGRLIESLGGAYFASKDQGVGANQLDWIGRATGYVVGLRCKRDTGEATAWGVASAIHEAARQLDMIRSSHAGTLSEDAPLSGGSINDTGCLAGLRILVIGVGKVGLPLAQILEESGADMRIYDPELVDNVEAFYRATRARGAAIDETHLDLLRRFAVEKRIFRSEVEALSWGDCDVLSPNGGDTGWLSSSATGCTDPRFETLSRIKQGGGHLRLVVGAGNEQLGSSASRVIESFTTFGIVFIPDAIASPGGVVAVSHELEPEWNADDVNRDTIEIVAANVRRVFRMAGSHATPTSSAAIATAYVQLLEADDC